MKKFMDKDFLLETKTAKKLFKISSEQPVYDYHCHLSPKEIAENKNFENLTQIWLGGDHYKWRLMRALGTEEKYITGDAPDYDKYIAWVKTLEKLIGNPLYHWSHLEMQRYFGINEPITSKNADYIWETCNKMLTSKELSVRNIFEKFNIYAVGTTDDPVDSLEYHKLIKDGKSAIGDCKTKVIPSFRPEEASLIEKETFPSYIEKLEKCCCQKITDFDSLIACLEKRLDFFIENGCQSADISMDYPPFVLSDKENIEKIFQKGLKKEFLTKNEIDIFKTEFLVRMANIYAKKNVVMQLHLSVIRNTNEKMKTQCGINTGFDAIHDFKMTENLSNLLSRIVMKGNLPKTIIYTLNPKDYYPIASIMGSFQGDSSGSNVSKGKMQLGSAWWFLDNKDGMEQQMRILANQGSLSAFVGMLTDSRSFLSYSRHEYFRRILCNLIGKWVENGEFPDDEDLLKEIIEGISFKNAKEYFER